MYEIKVSGILEGAKVGVFVGIRQQSEWSTEKYLAGCLWRCLYSARFYSQMDVMMLS
jgi:hypothetical protein